MYCCAGFFLLLMVEMVTMQDYFKNQLKNLMI